eukprot:Lithocolla_globosa_v1_NODE_6797_length_1033_cov_7.426380.p2 type:complete len:106 gc:universal NODE_6797_length_1033_cov_7.426380:427-744(+)
MELAAHAARKPNLLKLNSFALQSAKPNTIGTRVRFTRKEVLSCNKMKAKTTVKKGAADLTVSVKETATFSKLTRPKKTVKILMEPKIDMSITNFWPEAKGVPFVK